MDLFVGEFFFAKKIPQKWLTISWQNHQMDLFFVVEFLPTFPKSGCKISPKKWPAMIYVTWGKSRDFVGLCKKIYIYVCVP